MPPSVIASFRNVCKEFPPPRTGLPPVQVLENVDLDVHEGEFLALVGPSGCGKSTLLNILAGLVGPTAGAALFQSRPITAINTAVGYATQDSNLLPWLTLKQNVELGLEIKGYPRAERTELLRKFIQLVGLQGFENNYPFQLSGGMQKRASIIRSLIYNPAIMLMDEPFGSLDAHTKLLLHHELLKLWEQNRTTILFVTHDLAEAIALSDRIAIISQRPGRVKRIFPVPLPRPRNVFDIHSYPEFSAIYQTIWQSLREEFVEHAAAAAGEE